MQKKLIALAVAGLAATGAYAQSNVTIYGQVSAGFEAAKLSANSNNASNPNRVAANSYNRVQDQTSRIGFKGVEALGNGLSAVWQIETGLDLSGDRQSYGDNLDMNNAVTKSSGSGRLGNRNSYVGLTGGFGTFVMGRHDTPYKMATQKLNVFAGTTADYAAIVGEGAGRFDLRANNAVAYLSPNFNGLGFAVAYVAPELTEKAQNSGLANNISPSAWSLSANYDNGPVAAALAYEKHKNFSTFTRNTGAVSQLALQDNSGAAFSGVGLGSGASESAVKLSLAYTFATNSFVGVLYEKIKSETDANTLDALNTVAAGAAVLTGAHTQKVTHYGLSGQYDLGNNFVLKAQYLKASDLKRETGKVADSGTTMYTIGADYNLSKRTAVYAMYAKVNNDDAQRRGLFYGVDSGVTGSPSRGQDSSILGAGIRHSF